MKYRYTKFTGDELDDLDLEDLVARLSDLLLSSGFGNPYATDEDDRTLQALHDAILEELIQQIIERMTEQGYISMPPDLEAERARRQGQTGPGAGNDAPPVTFEV